VAKIATEKYNFAISNPEMVKQWHPTKNGKFTPYNITPNSTYKFHWICEKGHEWEATAHNRKTGNGCPYCANRKVCNDNSLKTLRPEIAKQWHPTKNGILTPDDVTVCAGVEVWWVCEKGHEWKTYIYNRTKGVGCPYCSNKKICKDNSLATCNSELAKQWHPTKNKTLTPHNVAPHSGIKVWWLCENNHEWESSINDRTRGNGCPKCTKRISKSCVKWLDEQNINEREKYIFINKKRFYVDGFNKNTIFEFLGDYWHGNPIKFNPDNIHPIIKKSFGDLLYKTINKLNYLYNCGYIIIYKWESIEQNFEYNYIDKHKEYVLETSRNFFNNNRKDNILLALEI
jgi:hypothetical protein